VTSYLDNRSTGNVGEMIYRGYVMFFSETVIPGAGVSGIAVREIVSKVGSTAWRAR